MARSWLQLSPSYRSRLLGAGRSGKLTGTKLTGSRPEVEAQAAAYYESAGTGQLTRARSHANPNYVSRPSTAAPKRATALESVGMGDSRSWDQLERWRAKSSRHGGPPSWLPTDPQIMSTDVAAILSQLDIIPSRWKTVTFNWILDPEQGSGAVVVVITPKRGRDRSIILPDYQAAQQLGSFLKNHTEGVDIESPINSPTPGQVAA